MSRARRLLWLNRVLLVATIVLWVVATLAGWLHSVVFLSHISMAALLLTSIDGITSGRAAVEAERSE